MPRLCSRPWWCHSLHLCWVQLLEISAKGELAPVLLPPAARGKCSVSSHLVMGSVLLHHRIPIKLQLQQELSLAFHGSVLAPGKAFAASRIVLESQKHSSWKRLLRASGPTSCPTPPSPLHHVLKADDGSSMKGCRGGWSLHSSSSPTHCRGEAKMLQRPSSWKRAFLPLSLPRKEAEQTSLPWHLLAGELREGRSEGLGVACLVCP